MKTVCPYCHSTYNSPQSSAASQISALGSELLSPLLLASLGAKASSRLSLPSSIGSALAVGAGALIKTAINRSVPDFSEIHLCQSCHQTFIAPSA